MDTYQDCLKNKHIGAGETVQRLTGFHPVDLSLVLNVHVRWPVTPTPGNIMPFLASAVACHPSPTPSPPFFFFFLRDLSLDANEDVSDGQ